LKECRASKDDGAYRGFEPMPLFVEQVGMQLGLAGQTQTDQSTLDYSKPKEA
jgi:hypothetical protein